jgi:hypothetical protein
LPFQPLRQEKDEVSAAYGVRSYPVTYLVGPDQKIALRLLGFRPEELRAALETVLPKK